MTFPLGFGTNMKQLHYSAVSSTLSSVMSCCQELLKLLLEWFWQAKATCLRDVCMVCYLVQPVMKVFNQSTKSSKYIFKSLCSCCVISPLTLIIILVGAWKEIMCFAIFIINNCWLIFIVRILDCCLCLYSIIQICQLPTSYLCSGSSLEPWQLTVCALLFVISISFL